MLTSTNHRHAQLIVSDLSVTRGAKPVLSHVDLVVTPTSRMAIVGENGRGKSTLLHVLDGTLIPDSGSVQRVGTIGVAEQEMPAHDDRTVGHVIADAVAEPLAALAALDAAMLSMSDGTADAAREYAFALESIEALDAWDAERRVQIALAALDAETDPDRLLETLSIGQRYRVRLACLLGAHHDFLLLDEPTNHLDRSGLEFLSAQLKARRGGVAIVTHDRALLTDVADIIVDLDPSSDGRIRLYGNGYDGYRKGRLAERALWEQEYDRQQTEHSRLKDSLSVAQNRLQSGWRPEKGTDKHGRATRAGGLVQSVHRRQERLQAHAVSVPEPPQQFRFPELTVNVDAVLLCADRISRADRMTRETSISLTHGDRLVVTGPNGAGKSTLLSMLAGAIQPTTGTVRRAQRTRLAFLRQETDLPMHQRACEVYSAQLDQLIKAGRLDSSEAIGLTQLGLLGSREASKQVGELSTGQQRRLNLAMILSTRPHVLLLDEPTNHLSISLVDELTEALAATRAAVVLSTHDRQFLRDVSDWPSIELNAKAVNEAPG